MKVNQILIVLLYCLLSNAQMFGSQPPSQNSELFNNQNAALLNNASFPSPASSSNSNWTTLEQAGLPFPDLSQPFGTSPDQGGSINPQTTLALIEARREQDKRKAKSLKLKEAQRLGKLERKNEADSLKKHKEEMEEQRRKEQLMEEARLAELQAKKLEEENEKRRQIEEERKKQEMINQQKFEEEQREQKRLALEEAEKVKEAKRVKKQKKLELMNEKNKEAEAFAKRYTQKRLLKMWQSNVQENKRERQLEAQASIFAQRQQKIRGLKSFQTVVDSHKKKKALIAAMQKKASDFNTALQIKRNKSLERQTFIRWLDAFSYQQEFKKAIAARAKAVVKKAVLKDKEREFKERRKRALVLKTYEHWKNERAISSYAKIMDTIETQASDYYKRKLQQKSFKALHLNASACKEMDKQAEEFALQSKKSRAINQFHANMHRQHQLKRLAILKKNVEYLHKHNLMQQTFSSWKNHYLMQIKPTIKQKAPSLFETARVKDQPDPELAKALEELDREIALEATRQKESSANSAQLQTVATPIMEASSTPKTNVIRILGPISTKPQPIVQTTRFRISPLLAEELARCLFNYKLTCAESGCPQDQSIIDSHNQLARSVVENERTANQQLKLFRANRKAIDRKIRQQIAPHHRTAATAVQQYHAHGIMPFVAQIDTGHNQPVKNSAAGPASTVSVQFQKLVTLNYKDQFDLERDKYIYIQLSSHPMIKQDGAVQNTIKDELRALTRNISIFKENMADELEKFKKNASSIVDQHENRLKREMGTQKINSFMQNRVLKYTLQKWKKNAQAVPGKSQLPETNSQSIERTKPIHVKTNSDQKHANENATSLTKSPALAQKHNQPLTIFDAIRADSQTAVGLFIIQGAINSRDHKGKTPIYHAIAQNKVAMVGFLLDHDADMSIRDNRRVSTSDIIRSREMARMIDTKMREVIARKTGQAHVWLKEKWEKK